MLKDFGLSAWAVASPPNVKTHDLDVPRIGYIHSWTRTQDEGWWRAALDTFGVPYTRPRVVMQFSSDPNNLLLSGTLANGQFLTNRAAALDHPLGKGHVVMFAIRPFWRWQTQGTYTLGFNAIMNWNDLDAGKAAPPARPTSQPQP